MNREGNHPVIAVALAVLCLLAGGVLLSTPDGALALPSDLQTSSSSGTGYTLAWWTVDGGGTTSAAGGGYSISATIGQPDSAVWSNGEYALFGGFWGRTVLTQHRIHLPLILRQG